MIMVAKRPLIVLIVPLCCLMLPMKSHAATIASRDVASISTLVTSSAIAQNSQTYRVKLGDTLSGIAVKLGLTVTQLLNYNPNLRANPNLLQIGQLINLTPTATVQKPQTRKRPTKPRQSAFSRLNIPRERRQGSRISAAKRGINSCLKNPNQSLKILLPNTNFGYTLQDYPTFFWYVPQLTESSTTEFSLFSTANETLIYEATINNPTPETIASFSLPADAPALKEGEEYEWEIRIKCNKDDSINVRGRIQRLTTDNPALVRKLEKVGIEDYPAIFAEAGIWYDAMATLAALRRENPQDESLSQDWAEILTKIGYQDLTNVPEKTVTAIKKTTNQ